MRNPRAHGFTGWAAPAFGLICALLVLALASATAQAEALPDEQAADWHLRKETDGIRVYTTEQPGSRFEAFKAVATLDVPIENLMAVMIDPTSCVAWVHNCVESQAFGPGDFHDRFAYSVNDMPWPVADRDYVLHIRTRGERDTGVILMDRNATPDQRPNTQGRTRVDRSDTRYRFTPEGDRTRMVWIQHTDPNGTLPGWLVNALVIDIPVRSMQALERVARQPRYQGFRLVWDDHGRLVDVAGPGS